MRRDHLAPESIAYEYQRLAYGAGPMASFPLDAISLNCDARNARWGEFHTPNPLLVPVREEFVQSMVASGALRVNLFGSFYRGVHVLEALIELERTSPGVAMLTGFCTDGADSQDAKISVAKRVWQYIPPEERENFMLQGVYRALRYGVPCFTGEVKVDSFTKDILPGIFAPDVILMATFGQQINPEIFSQARFGMYNFHASSVAPLDGPAKPMPDSAQGALGNSLRFPGPNPFDDMLNAGETHTRMTVHRVDEDFDHGQVVGYSPPICITLENPEGWTRAEHIIALHQRTSAFAAPMAQRLLDEIHFRKSEVQALDFESEFLSNQAWPGLAARFQAPIPGLPKDHIPHGVLTGF